ncbi:retrovirus-related Pol polyprotein from type-2 retrotransposable element R2DM [Caerostris extrusa]|uniref:Retrovirus-related Pol polyprotein from type-2 retrotransposable element R2DM n=1 Tax=Caerostris extrusa TaxID=172846 RepID=A0AAV4Y0B2_CAEEX|nr:retrovirus-related Pol polyprotein from type-2 retrotransposable element R2DM [Caerostris extrusa]
MKRLGLHLNPNKSFAFHLRGSTPVGTCDSSFFINNHRLIPVHEGEFHKFLGKPIGFKAVPNYSSLNDLGIKLATTKLTPWQRLYVLKTFFYSSLQFPMRTAQFPKRETGAKLTKSSSRRDELCAKSAIASLQSTVHKRIGRLPDDQILSDYMSGDIGGDFSTTSNKFSNTWYVARVASRRLGVQWIFENSVPSLVFKT